MAAEQTVLPRWRGFNLLGLFSEGQEGRFPEDDFRWIADWGFDFVRLPMMYTLWVDGDPFTLKEEVLARIDEAVAFGRKHGIHVCLNLHTAPGYRVSATWQDPFGLNLWKNDRALEAFCFHWRMFAERYKGIASDRLSFNLVNEPAAPVDDPADGMTRADHARVMRATTAAVREVDPDRLIIIDGVSWGNACSPDLADLGAAQSCRGYKPMAISHHAAPWSNCEGYGEPVWPGCESRGRTWDREALKAFYGPWIDLARQGVGVHCGEGGAYNRTPHDVVLRWFRDVLEVLTAANIGYALWNFRGPFGILDSGRDDVAYEDHHGRLLDRGLLALLQEF